MPRPFLLTLEYPPQLGGVAKYLEGEVKSFDGEVVVSVVKVNWKRLFGRARQEFKKSGCDYLWLSHVLPMGYIALVWKCVYKTRYRVYLHGLDLVRPKSSPWKRFWVKMILKNADEIVVNSNATAGLLKNYGIEPSRARVQYPKINPPLPEGGLGGWENWREYYAEQGNKLRQKYNINNKPVLLTISRLVKRKGIDLVIKSLPAVWRQIPGLVYVVVGDGEEREYLEGLAKSVIPSEAERSEAKPRNLVDYVQSEKDEIPPLVSTLGRDDVLFLGPVSDDEKYGWLSACNCFLLTPIDDPNDFEGYGIVYKEAQMFGKPVIGSRVGGVPEAIGNDGTLIASNDVNAISGAIIDVFRKFPITNFQ